MRKAELIRKTNETNINIKLNIDGSGKYSIDTPNGFFTHMLELFSKHSGVDIDLRADGDTHVDLHHTVEDTAIVLGQALSDALGDRRGIVRYSSVMMPMDEVRVDVLIDLGGRSNFVYKLKFSPESDEQNFDYSLVKEFIKALSDNMKATIHVFHKSYECEEANNHHIAEAVFKGLAYVIKHASKVENNNIPSTKGII